MAKKHKRAAAEDLREGAPAAGGISSRGKRVIAAGIATTILGFLVLTKVDPLGQNWAGTLSPILILGGIYIARRGA